MMAPYFHLDSEPLFWGLNWFLCGCVWVIIGIAYARHTYDRYFELDIDGFDTYKRVDIIFFPSLALNYFRIKSESPAMILTTKEKPYLTIMMLFWPLKLISLIFWSVILLMLYGGRAPGRFYFRTLD